MDSDSVSYPTNLIGSSESHEAKCHLYDSDSSIDNSAEGSQEPVTQREVFGSDTESEHLSEESKQGDNDLKCAENFVEQDSKPLKSSIYNDSTSNSPVRVASQANGDLGLYSSEEIGQLSEFGEEEELDQEPGETRIAVDFPLIRADLGREMHLVKMPNFLSVETRPFDPNFYEDELDEDEILDEEGRTRLKLKVENTIRWRISKIPDGDMVHESNARIVRWSDGSLSLHLGDEIFDIHKVDIQSDFNYLFIREGSGLQGQSSLKTKLTFRPHSTDSFTHRKITLSLADKTNKSQKVKILPVAGADPESNRLALVRKEEEKLRAALRRESQLRRMREKQAMSRSGFGGDRRRTHSGGRGGDGVADDEDDDDANTTSLNMLKRNAKAAFTSSRKDVSTIYSSDSESLSDLSEQRQRKKFRAKISDDEESS